MNNEIFSDVDKWESGELGASAEHAVSVAMNPKLRHLLDKAKKKEKTPIQGHTATAVVLDDPLYDN